MSGYRYNQQFPVNLPGSRQHIFAALTDASKLQRWFAEHMEVGQAAGEPFRFWGRYSFATPTPEAATQQISAWSPDQSISFTWRVLGQETKVTWSIEDEDTDEGPALRFRVAHEFAALPAGERVEALIDDLWRIHAGNLCFHLNGQDPAWIDFTDPSPVVRCQIEIDAPPARVFRALIEPEHIRQWFPAPAPRVEPRVGGDYGFGFSFEHEGQRIEPPPMVISEYVQDQVLAMNWPDWRLDPTVPDQAIRWELKDLGQGRTRLTLTHTGFTRSTDVSDYPFGWQEFLDKIGAVAAAMAD